MTSIPDPSMYSYPGSSPSGVPPYDPLAQGGYQDPVAQAGYAQPGARPWGVDAHGVPLTS